MLICSECGSTSPDGTKFCPNCGASLATRKKAGCFSTIVTVIAIFVIVCLAASMCSPKEPTTESVQDTKETTTTQTIGNPNSEVNTNSDRPQKDGFDDKTNKTVVIGSYQIKVPAYLSKGSYSDANKTYLAEAESGEQSVIILIGFKSGTYSYDSLNSNKETMINNLRSVNHDIGVQTGGVQYSDYTSKYGKGLMVEYASIDTINGVSVLIYNRYVLIPVNSGCLVFMLEQSSQSKCVYTNDFDKMINSAEIKKPTPTKKSNSKKKKTKKSAKKKSSKRKSK